MSKTDYPVTQCHSQEEQYVEPYSCENLELKFLVVCNVSVEVIAVRDSPNTEKWVFI
jgi:hypothetical protein